MPLRGFPTLALLVLGLGFATSTVALAQERLALVVGNTRYQTVVSLDNAGQDASLIARSLEQTGFDVTLLLDATQTEFNGAIATFGRRLRASGDEATGLFYYAGHAVQSFGNNYLLPTDVVLTDAADLPLVGVNPQSVLQQMASARNRTNIVILDACRNNPFESIPDMNDNGLAEMKAPTGTFLSYATAPGEVALDGLGSNSPFTEALARRLHNPGVPIEQMFKSVRVDVLRATNGRQVPWDTSSLTNDFSFVAETPAPQDNLSDAARWDAARKSGDPVEVVLFIRDRPGSAYEAEAQALLSQLIAGVTPGQVSEPETAAVEPLVPQIAVPGATEQDMFAAARAAGTREEYQAFLDAFPDGVFAELAASEISVLDQNSLEAAQPAQSAIASPSDQVAPIEPVIFTSPLTAGGPEVQDRTFDDLIAGTPLFAPFEGLPEQLWKENTCSSCHKWDRQNLCELGQSYLKRPESDLAELLHPYGGGFKSNIRGWAENECR